jgi:hypothetical protein
MSRRTVKSEFRMSPAKQSTVSLIMLILCTIVVQSCGQTASSNVVHIKSSATGEKDLAIKSGYAFAITKTFTDINGKMTTASAYNVYLANYDLDSRNFAMSMDKPLTGDDQVRVVFNLIGEEGTNDKSPPKAGAYSAKADKFLKTETVGLVARRNSADLKSWLDRTTLTGEVKVTTASADEISGNVDLSSGDISIKGSFTARVLKRK